MPHYADKLISGLRLEAAAIKKPTLFDRLIVKADGSTTICSNSGKLRLGKFRTIPIRIALIKLCRTNEWILDMESIFKSALFSRAAKAIFISVFFYGLISIAIYFEAWIITVTILYSMTILFVIIFFNRSFEKWTVLYFYLIFISVCISSYATIYEALGVLDSGNNSLITEESDFIYFSVVTWTTLGYGDFRPAAETRLFAASQASLGYLYMSILIAKIFHWLAAREQSQNFYIDE